MSQNVLRIHPTDTVAVALEALEKGSLTRGLSEELALAEDIPQGHKLALFPMAPGEEVIKYGCPIGRATKAIRPGQHVHVHNLQTGLRDMLTYAYHPKVAALPAVPAGTFQGFARKDGGVGVRNDIWILPTVGCVNGIAQQLMKLAQPFAHGSVERVIAFPHPYGCSQMGEDQEATRAILADLAAHPNAGGVLLLGLGCENSGIPQIAPLMGRFDPERVRFLVCQDTEDELRDGLRLLRELIDQAASLQREPIPASRLTVGLKCGGSDGFSGITANPVIGAFSDRLVAGGGAAILTEVPEMFGAETLLMDRCQSEGVFAKTVALINDFKQYYEDNHQPIYENPSPGNKAGGISTLEDKALGCTQKSGSAPVTDVLAYGEKVKCPGLNLLSAPGNDLVASTALAAAGAHIVLFSTGRGTPFASPVPTVKISSNTGLSERKSGWIDFDAGRVVSRGLSIQALGDELYAFVLAVASGQTILHEKAGIHDMAIFKRGVTL